MSQPEKIKAVYRRFQPMDDYEGLASIWNESFTNARRSKVEWWMRDRELNTDAPAQRWLAEVDGEILATAGYEYLDEEGFRPHHFQGYVTVHPALRRLGVGGELYELMLADLLEREPESLWMWTRADYEDGGKFLEKRGFRELYRMRFMRLPISPALLDLLEPYAQSLMKQGYEFKSFQELAEDSERNEKFYPLYKQVKHSIPSPVKRNLPDFAEFNHRVATSPYLFGGCFVATFKGKYVGLGILLERDNEERELYTDSLGVLPEHRRQGVALGIVWAGVRYAASIGSRFISEDNFIGNNNVNPLLEKVGFVPEPDWILREKKFGTNE